MSSALERGNLCFATSLPSRTIVWCGEGGDVGMIDQVFDFAEDFWGIVGKSAGV